MPILPRSAALGVGIACCALPFTAVPASAAAPHAHAHAAHHHQRDARLTVVHGVRGLVADIDVDGKQVLTSFAPRRTAGPLRLRPGVHHVVVLRHGTHHRILSTRLRLDPAEHMTVALGLNTAGHPAVFSYDDALRASSKRAATLVMRDVADAHRYVAVVNGHATGALAAGHQLRSAVHAGTYTVAVRDRRTHRTVVPSRRVPVTSGDVTALYLIGSQASHDLTWIAETFTPSGATPRAVQTGTSGLAAPAGTPWPAITALSLGVAGLLGAAAAGTAAARRRRVLA